MEKKLFDANCITLDGRLDEPVWQEVTEYTDFKRARSSDSQDVPYQSFFRIIPCEDRIYIGMKCLVKDAKKCYEINKDRPFWTSEHVEFFISPSGGGFEFYQIAISAAGKKQTYYYSEGGNIQPDRYAPDFDYAVYVGDDYWSVEASFPLTAFYMTKQQIWSDVWSFNVCRVHYTESFAAIGDAWQQVDVGFREPDRFATLEGFPIRPACDDVKMTSAFADIINKTDKGYCGTMKVTTVNAVDGMFEFSSSNTGTVQVELKTGANEFAIPCCFEKSGANRLSLQLKRMSDGKVFKRYYPIKIEYEAIRLCLTQPEYRNNFYPGQDYSKVAGTVFSATPVTLKLEGPGIETQVISPNADGSFVFNTPNFEVGDAYLTATIEGEELVKKIRRLAPTGRQMSWISGGNLMVNGKPVLRRNVWAPGYHGGEALKHKYSEEYQHETVAAGKNGYINADMYLFWNGYPMAEVTADGKPSKTMYDFVDSVIDGHKNTDFTYYYLGDEPECRAVSPVYLKYLYDYIAERDPYHVVHIASRAIPTYLNAADWFEVHPYINPMIDRNGNRCYEVQIPYMGNCVDDLIKLNRPDKCVGFVSTCFSYKGRNNNSEYPTFEEYICHIWAAMIHGGKTLASYAYHDINDRAALYEGNRYVFSSFEALEELVLQGERTSLFKNQDVHCVEYALSNEKMFALVNMTSDTQKVTVDNLTGAWYNFRNEGMITGNTFELKPFEVVIGTTERKDEGLPTYAETEALIAELEYVRTHRENLLFERYLDIPIQTSKGRRMSHKMLDGIRDNYAWEHAGEGEKYFEMNLTKVKPTFKKVSVYGYNIEDMKLLLRENGELVAPAVADVKVEEFATIFTLQDAISPDGLRFEFNSEKEKIELYEIEVF